MGVRTDISESPEYMADAYLAKATALAADTTGRDTIPGYQTVSALVQQMTTEILDGASGEGEGYGDRLGGGARQRAGSDGDGDG